MQLTIQLQLKKITHANFPAIGHMRFNT